MKKAALLNNLCVPSPLEGDEAPSRTCCGSAARRRVRGIKKICISLFKYPSSLKWIPAFAGMTAFFLSSLALADVPVVSLAPEASLNGSHQESLSIEARLKLLESKMEFIERARLTADLQDVKQKIQALEGSAELQQRQLEKLSNQQTDFYRDIDARLSERQANQVPVAVDLPAKDNPQLGVDDGKAYRQAYHSLTIHNYPQAQQAFSQFVQTYPQSAYAANAHYWLGELYIQAQDPSRALQEFNFVKNNYPQHDKVADARYKIGLLSKAQGNIVVARQEWQEVTKLYPKSTAAQLAAVQLRLLPS